MLLLFACLLALSCADVSTFVGLLISYQLITVTMANNNTLIYASVEDKIIIQLDGTARSS
jgi:hypothetical protein